MPKTRWKNWLKGERYKPKDPRKDTKKKKHQREWRMMCDIRKRAQQAMDDLTLIFEQLPKNSKHPDRHYAMIFQNENRYFKLLEAMNKAYEESYKSKMKLFAPENLNVIQSVCLEAGMPVRSKRQLSNRRFRNKLFAELNRRKTENGESYFERAHLRAFYAKMRRESQKECDLISAILQISYDPKDEGLTVGSLFRETVKGSVCIGYKTCRKIRDAVRAALKPG